jgi:hypothetical protein
MRAHQAGASVAQTAIFAICGSSLVHAPEPEGRLLFLRFVVIPAEEPRILKTGGAALQILDPQRGAPRTQATSLSPGPIRGLFWLQ